MCVALPTLALQSSDRFADIRGRFVEAGQAHVFQWYDDGRLTAEQADALYVPPASSLVHGWCTAMFFCKLTLRLAVSALRDRV